MNYDDFLSYFKDMSKPLDCRFLSIKSISPLAYYLKLIIIKVKCEKRKKKKELFLVIPTHNNIV